MFSYPNKVGFYSIKHPDGRQSISAFVASTLSAVRMQFPIEASIMSAVRVLYPIEASILSAVRMH